jgi:hypothetical protein
MTDRYLLLARIAYAELIGIAMGPFMFNIHFAFIIDDELPPILIFTQ